MCVTQCMTPGFSYLSHTSFFFFSQWSRYHIARINMDQILLRRITGGKICENKTLIFDGVKVGYQAGLQFIDREYELPHNFLPGTKGKPSDLVHGSNVSENLMLRIATHRDTLHTLVYGKKGNFTVPKHEFDLLDNFDATYRSSALKPYIKVEPVAGDRVRLCRSTHHIHKVLAHWSCAVPEIKLIPPPLIEIC